MTTLFEELSRVTTYDYTEDEVREFEVLHDEIRKLKKERNAVIVAHNYYRPEILKVADFVGDSLELALMASKVKDADVIEFAGVNFMAETAKIVNPAKTVLLPNAMAGCQLADSAPAEDLAARVEELKKQYPDLAVVSYVNTTAAVKALSDIIVTSANAAKVVRTLPNENILFVPDRNLAHHVAAQVPEKNIIPWDGYCYVHQQITPEEIARIRRADPEPDSRPSGMPPRRRESRRRRPLHLGRGSLRETFVESLPRRHGMRLSDRLAMEVPDKQFLKGCKLCAFMKVTTLEDVRDSLLHMQYEITVPEEVRVPAGGRSCGCSTQTRRADRR
jgi:quinolinate synthase